MLFLPCKCHRQLSVVFIKPTKLTQNNNQLIKGVGQDMSMHFDGILGIQNKGVSKIILVNLGQLNWYIFYNSKIIICWKTMATWIFFHLTLFLRSDLLFGFIGRVVVQTRNTFLGLEGQTFFSLLCILTLAYICWLTGNWWQSYHSGFPWREHWVYSHHGWCWDC